MAAGRWGTNTDWRSYAARRRVAGAELGAMAPDGISIHAARIPFGAYKPGGTMDPTLADDPVRAFADPPLVDDAAELLASAPLHALRLHQQQLRTRCRR